jgi:hypothetical protein
MIENINDLVLDSNIIKGAEESNDSSKRKLIYTLPSD